MRSQHEPATNTLGTQVRECWGVGSHVGWGLGIGSVETPVSWATVWRSLFSIPSICFYYLEHFVVVERLLYASDFIHQCVYLLCLLHCVCEINDNKPFDVIWFLNTLVKVWYFLLNSWRICREHECKLPILTQHFNAVQILHFKLFS